MKRKKKTLPLLGLCWYMAQGRKWMKKHWYLSSFMLEFVQNSLMRKAVKSIISSIVSFLKCDMNYIKRLKNKWKKIILCLVKQHNAIQARYQGQTESQLQKLLKPEIRVHQPLKWLNKMINQCLCDNSRQTMGTLLFWNE